MGTDAGGVEHSDIVREYAYAASLIAFWKRTDPAFRTAFGNADASSLSANVNWHLADMASDTALAY